MTKKKIIFARLIAFLIIFVNVTSFTLSIIEDYKKYTGSEALTAEVTGIEGIKSEKINVKYKYSFDGQKYEEGVIQPIRDIKVGDMKEIRIWKSDPKKIIPIDMNRVIISDIGVGFGIFTLAFIANALIGCMAKYYKEIEIGKCTKENK